MIVRVTLAVDVDPATWRKIYGDPQTATQSGLRRDVRDYVQFAIENSAAADEGAIRSVKAS
jgi:hypothetical protein